MDEARKKALRDLPSVDELADSNRLDSWPRPLRVAAARYAIGTSRRAILAGKPLFQSVEDLAISWALAAQQNSIKPVINASGVILHTGLGRARLAESAVRAIREAAESHATVEFDLVSGARGDRQDHVRDLICELTGAEDALVVNNCASAVLLSLATLAFGKSVVLSRGQMVEIGGSFRMPDVVRQSGARLVEVGCTNKTHLSDYEEALNPEAGVLLRCHPSNFRVTGFTEEPSLSELAELAHTRGVSVIDDVGSGCLVDTTRFGLPHEPKFGDGLAQGADLELSSGDKMLGGPQAGLIIGKRDLIAKLKAHPIARAVRIDKLTLAALAATLKLYREGREFEIPTLWALARPIEEVRSAAERLASAYSGAVVEAGITETGGGSLPGYGVPTYRCGLAAPHEDQLAHQLRTGDPAIVGRIERGSVWLDPRTMTDAEVDTAVRRLREISA